VRFVGTLVTTSAPLLVGSHTTPSRLCNRGPAVVADWVTGEQVESVSQADPPIACNLIGPRRTSEPTPHWPTCGFFGGGSRRLTRKRRKRQPQDSTRGVSADHSAFCCRRIGEIQHSPTTSSPFRAPQWTICGAAPPNRAVGTGVDSATTSAPCGAERARCCSPRQSCARPLQDAFSQDPQPLPPIACVYVGSAHS